MIFWMRTSARSLLRVGVVVASCRRLLDGRQFGGSTRIAGRTRRRRGDLAGLDASRPGRRRGPPDAAARRARSSRSASGSPASSDRENGVPTTAFLPAVVISFFSNSVFSTLDELTPRISWISGSVIGWRYAMIASVSRAASERRLRSVTSWNLRSSAVELGPRHEAPAAGDLLEADPAARRPRSARARSCSASATAAGVASRSSARSFSRTGRDEEKSTASTAVADPRAGGLASAAARPSRPRPPRPAASDSLMRGLTRRNYRVSAAR